jgi:HSP20 family molecular chaperone IbpA
MALLPRFAAGEFSPLFQLLDDYATHQSSRTGLPPVITNASSSFQPRFDVREVKDAYQLEGELPGIDQNHVEIEFIDPQTLCIRGRIERTYKFDTTPAAIQSKPEQAQITQDDAGSTEYQQPCVEDKTGLNAARDAPQKNKSAMMSQARSQHEERNHRYWISERSTGEFQRIFNFPASVDQDQVKASLKNGLLSVLVPKVQARSGRNISIE